MIYPSYEMLLCNSMSTTRSSWRLVSNIIFYCHNNTLWLIITCFLGHQTNSVLQLQNQSTLGPSKNPGVDLITMKPLARCCIRKSTFAHRSTWVSLVSLVSLGLLWMSLEIYLDLSFLYVPWISLGILENSDSRLLLTWQIFRSFIYQILW